MKVVVVGAGLGGLAATAHLVGRGHDVTVVERQAGPGGRAGCSKPAGTRLDTGPTVLTMPGLLADAFAAVGADMADFCTIKAVDPMYRAVYADGSVLRVWHGRERMTQEIAEVAGGKDAAAFGPFCDWLAELYRVEMAHFIDTNYDSVLDLARPLGPALQLLRLGGFRKLANVVRSYFGDERLQRIFSFQSMYAGLAPYEALALYAVITYMDSVEGVFVPEGGMHAMASGLAAAVEKAGATFRYEQPVERIVRAPGPRGRVLGVEVGAGVGARSATASSSTPTPWCATPTCPSPTARCSTASRRRAPLGAAPTRRRASCGWPACGASRPRRRPTTTSTSARRGTAPSRPSSTRAGACPTRRSS